MKINDAPSQKNAREFSDNYLFLYTYYFSGQPCNTPRSQYFIYQEHVNFIIL